MYLFTCLTNIRYHENKPVRTHYVMYSNYLLNVPVTSLLWTPRQRGMLNGCLADQVINLLKHSDHHIR